MRAARGFLLRGLEGNSIVNGAVTARVQQVRRRAWPLVLDPGQWLLAAGPDYAAAAGIAPGDTVRLYGRLPPARDALVEAIGGGRTNGAPRGSVATRLARVVVVGS